MEVGNNVHINRGALIRAEGGLTVGDNVHCARNLTIYTINHNYKGQALPYDHTMIREPVIIERNVWIGINVTVVPGVRIAEGAIVAAGSVVSEDVAPLTIVGGQQLRVLKRRDEEHYKMLEREGKYGGASGYPYASPSRDGGAA
jgi:maltose O-acetyltransferase